MWHSIPIWIWSASCTATTLMVFWRPGAMPTTASTSAIPSRTTMPRLVWAMVQGTSTAPWRIRICPVSMWSSSNCCPVWMRECSRACTAPAGTASFLPICWASWGQVWPTWTLPRKAVPCVSCSVPMAGAKATACASGCRTICWCAASISLCRTPSTRHPSRTRTARRISMPTAIIRNIRNSGR